MKQLLTHKILSGQQWSPYELLVVELGIFQLIKYNWQKISA